VLSQISELFFLQMAAGVCFSLLLFRSDALGKGFYILNTVLAIVALAVALLFQFSQPTPAGDTIRLTATAGLVFLIIAAILQTRQIRQWATPLFIGFLLTTFALSTEVRNIAPHVLTQPMAEDALRILTCLIGGFLLGASIVGMNLGHWYLIAKGLSFEVLESASKMFLIFVLARIILLAVTIGAFYFLPGPGRSALQMLWAPDGYLIFFLMRILWGLAGPLVLGVLVFRCVEIRSNTSATGLMYVIVVFLLIGELLANYVTVLSAIPV